MLTYMRLALKQLCRTMQSLPPELQAVYRCHDANDTQPTYEELRVVFLAIIQQFDRIFLVLDALDECTPGQREDLYKFILNSVNTTSTGTKQGIVKAFVTSRKDSDIERAFQRESISTVQIEAAKVNSDIEAYVKAQVELRLQNSSLRLRDMALVNNILNILTTKADGMYVFF